MVKLNASRPAAVDESALRQILADGLSAYWHKLVHIACLKRRPLESASTHAIDRLGVSLASGREFDVIFKRLYPMPEPKGGAREVLIYQRLLRGRRFGAPALYGSLYDEKGGRYWLFLEDVGECTLQHAEVADWTAAVRWLARMHRAYHERAAELRALGCLNEHGPEYYLGVARHARANLCQAAPKFIKRFDALMKRYDATVLYLAAQPRTLVHGDIFPQNLSVQRRRRIRPVDWESAAIGLGAWDLARLLDGWGEDKPTYLRAYLKEFTAGIASPFERHTFQLAFMHCELVNVLVHFAWSAENLSAHSTVKGLIDQLEMIWQQMDRGEPND